MAGSVTLLCVSTYFKGSDFLTAAHEAGATVYLVTRKALSGEPWPFQAIAECFYVESDDNSPENLWNMAQGLAFIMRQRSIDRIIALDDFDVEKGAFLREQFRIPGMGQTTARHFRDKLAMRMQAAAHGIPIPGFSALFNDDQINHFLATNPGPWMIKPRAEASATGIKKVHEPQQAWDHIHSLGDQRHLFLIEQFKPGDVYHTDSLRLDDKTIFCQVSKYRNPPFDVAHGGGIFQTYTLTPKEPETDALTALTSKVMTAFGLKFGASHTEFIRSHADGQYYFLETSSRVGGAHIAELVTFSTGINLWAEWARIEVAVATQQKYILPKSTFQPSGLLVSLSRFEIPDTRGFNDPEICWRMDKKNHVGFIVQSSSQERVLSLLDDYAYRVGSDLHASAPAPDKPTH